MKIVGLAGKAGAGKDFVYEAINRAVGSNQAVRRVAFADGVKLEIEAELNNGRNLPQLWSKPYSHEVRSLLQWWGTDFRRSENPNYWVEYGTRTLEMLESEGTDIACITDVRFQNEVDAVHANEGTVFLVTAGADVRARRLNITVDEQAKMATHATETAELVGFDGAVTNDFRTLFPASLNMYLGLPADFQPTGIQVATGG